MNIEYVKPDEIEARSFKIIAEETAAMGKSVDPKLAPVIFRAIHTTADFDYLDNLKFSEGVIDTALSALRSNALIITDTNMALSGINKTALHELGCEAVCFMADEDVAENAKSGSMTRAAASIDKAARIKDRNIILASGNAPTFLIRACELIERQELSPSLIIAMPVGFVNVVQSKELVTRSGVPYIAAMGRKGGSNVTAAVINALMYMLTR